MVLIMYNWKIEQHKVCSGQQELNVRILVKDLVETTGSTSEEWISLFKSHLKKIPKTNSFSAENGYKATQRNLTSLEVWKMKANGDFNYKMYTVTRIN